MHVDSSISPSKGSLLPETSPERRTPMRGRRAASDAQDAEDSWRPRPFDTRNGQKIHGHGSHPAKGSALGLYSKQKLGVLILTLYKASGPTVDLMMYQKQPSVNHYESFAHQVQVNYNNSIVPTNG